MALGLSTDQVRSMAPPLAGAAGKALSHLLCSPALRWLERHWKGPHSFRSLLIPETEVAFQGHHDGSPAGSVEMWYLLNLRGYMI